jgi:hypothetical protein
LLSALRELEEALVWLQRLVAIRSWEHQVLCLCYPAVVQAFQVSTPPGLFQAPLGGKAFLLERTRQIAYPA